MVFQSYAIWPHMKVFDNVAFPLQVMPRRSRLSKAGLAERTMKILELMELGDLADRQATKLSGGQQQRLALGRALVTEPALILLDEPLSNLDAKLRESLRFELKRFQREVGITSIYVTHDQVEALGLSTRIAVMRDGKVMQIGRPREIYEKPASRFVADFIGTSNFLRGTVVGTEKDLALVDTEVGRLRAAAMPTIKTGDPVTLALRPEGITISATPPGGDAANRLTGKVITRSYLGDTVDHLVRVGSVEFRVRVSSTTSIPPDTEVTLTVEPEHLRLIPEGD
jgi:iron(III) transport system ATP-binding protein